MSEVAQIEGRVRYSAFKKTVKVMITPTDSLDNLKAQLNTYFEHLGENQYTRHLFGQMSCIDLGEDRDEYAWKTANLPTSKPSPRPHNLQPIPLL
ncbi:hypothetical protein MTR_1g092520 [Medicago truncatula]|uniref:Uncharacterized protein n=1 Tax=Medicago truncatula TaxID=3880 RepID=G7I336_MEDTR|nr:hypothetical protein MTR_1g092520 [Medicago truncatula]